MSTQSTTTNAQQRESKMRIDDLDIYEDWQGLRAISPAKVLRLVERKDAEIDQLHRELIKIGLNRHEHFAPRTDQETGEGQ
jgi:hypothetical protein